RLLTGEHRSICVVGDPDQCLVEGTIVETPAGPKRIERIKEGDRVDRKSTRLNSSHGSISYAVFCLKKKKEKEDDISQKQIKKKKVWEKTSETDQYQTQEDHEKELRQQWKQTVPNMHNRNGTTHIVS